MRIQQFLGIGMISTYQQDNICFAFAIIATVATVSVEDKVLDGIKQVKTSNISKHVHPCVAFSVKAGLLCAIAHI